MPRTAIEAKVVAADSTIFDSREGVASVRGGGASVEELTVEPRDIPLSCDEDEFLVTNRFGGANRALGSGHAARKGALAKTVVVRHRIAMDVIVGE